MSAAQLYRPEAVFFDLDGTLIDTAPDFFRVMNMQRGQRGLPAMAYEAVRKTVSDGARAMVKLSFTMEETDAEFELLRQELLDLYLRHIAVDSRLFEGYEALLSLLESQGVSWGVVTNKPRLYSEALLQALGLNSRMAALVCPDDVSRTKPDPEPMLLASRLADCDPQRCWYVGDHIRDIQAGANAGMLTIAAAYGYLDEPESALAWNADHVAHSVEDIAALLKQVL
ncbi:predicted phosphatase [Hahella chejuensis KCTC 2396]|uniref:Predicted phosphatase n=1 Tax=Hahella chejuensis (strain KCTC 2396) TaxID=349521 RepID=Q2SE60_HAHCH|nr:HAD-IA family hydrolase [Hahella chejuensis]ABC31064.1 predicted phosphatase [Hahella chejuensis KCTC 2396]